MEKLVSQPRNSSVEGYHSALGRAKFESKRCLWGVLPSREKTAGQIGGYARFSVTQNMCHIVGESSRSRKAVVRSL